MLTSAQRADFERWGIVKIPRAFDADQAARMCDVVWRELDRRYDIGRDDPSTWNRHAPTGLKSSKKSNVFAPTLGPATSEALDDLFGVGEWVRPKHFGQVLVTMPNACEWRVPHKLWHGDFTYTRPASDLFAVKCWSIVAELPPGGGGTPQLAGSHRLVARFIGDRRGGQLEYKRVRDSFLKSHPWLKALTTDDADPDRNARFMGDDADIDGLPARVVEVCGEPGDTFITHPWVMHTIAPNASDRPRMMRSAAIYSVDYLASRRGTPSRSGDDAETDEHDPAPLTAGTATAGASA